MKKVVILTGAGISAESGIKTFRDAGGLWEGHDIMEVASPEGFKKNPALVLDFYNQRRRQLHEVSPNAAHFALVQLEKKFETYIITQNVDDLHERAGSKNVLHLHGELFKARSTTYPTDIIEWKEDILLGSLCSKGTQLRPHIVWFGEQVPAMSEAIKIAKEADIFIVIGTSLQVYPAAGLIDFVPAKADKYLIDPNTESAKNFTGIYKEKATVGTVALIDQLLN